MTREEAWRLIEDLKLEGSLGAAAGDPGLSVEVDSERGVLTCSAEIYRFSAEPAPAVLEDMIAEAGAGLEGGLRVDYDPKDRCLQVVRTYLEPPTVDELGADLEKLSAASLRD